MSFHSNYEEDLHIEKKHTKKPEILKWFGTVEVISDFLNQQQWISKWGVIKVMDIYLRSLGVVAFANNPFTGIFILIGLLVGDPLVALGTFIAALTGILTCKIIRAPEKDICNGVAIFNCILLGGVVTSLTPMVVDTELNIYYYIFLIFSAVVTILVDQGIQSAMNPSGLPSQSVAFNIVAVGMLMLMRIKLHGFGYVSIGEQIISNNTFGNTNQYLVVDWNKVMEGTVKAFGQVYGTGSTPGSIIIFIGFLIYSPILTLFLYIGSFLGAMLAVFLEFPPLSDIYVGLWSYNSLLASGALSFFVLQTPLGILTTIMAGVLALAFQTIYTTLFLQTALPVISYPFNTTVMILIAIGLKRDSPIQFVLDRTFPEDHLCTHYKLYGENHEKTDSLSKIETTKSSIEE